MLPILSFTELAFELGDGQDNYQVSYANPITAGRVAFVDGELASGTLEENPFGHWISVCGALKDSTLMPSRIQKRDIV